MGSHYHLWVTPSPQWRVNAAQPYRLVFLLYRAALSSNVTRMYRSFYVNIDSERQITELQVCTILSDVRTDVVFDVENN